MSKKTNIGGKSPSREYGRRPYVGGGDYMDMARSVTNKAVMDKRLEPHSEMQKPYAADDGYPEQEHYYPSLPGLGRLDLDFPSGSVTGHLVPIVPDIPNPTLPIVANKPGDAPCAYCVLTCYDSIVSDCDTDEAWCKPSIWCSYYPYPGNDGVQWGIQVTKGHVVSYNDKKWPNPTTPAIYIKFDPDIEEHKLVVTFMDMTGKVCFRHLTISCGCNCATADTFEFVAGSPPDTMVKNTSEVVYAQGGCPPFTWGTPGTGYSWATPTTIVTHAGGVTSNTLTCVDGTCGVNFAAYATVSITDNCGSNISAEIRNTAGGWYKIGSDVGTSVSACSPHGACPAANIEIISGYQKWILKPHGWCYKEPATWNALGAGQAYPPCGSPGDCAPGTCVGGCVGGDCFIQQFAYCEWGCSGSACY